MRRLRQMKQKNSTPQQLVDEATYRSTNIISTTSKVGQGDRLSGHQATPQPQRMVRQTVDEAMYQRIT